MKKSTFWIITSLTAVFFVALVWSAWTHRWGKPPETQFQPKERLTLTMPQLPRRLTLQVSDFEGSVWDELPPLTVPLMHQVTVPPWPTGLVPSLEVRAFHNTKDAYFLLEWKDEVESRTHDIAEFPDAAAISFPLTEDPPAESIMMGFQSLVNIWHWKGNLDAAFWNQEPALSEAKGHPEGKFSSNTYYGYAKKAAFPVRTAVASSGCQELLAARPGTVTLKEESSLRARGQWRDGRWRVIFTRALSTDDTQREAQITRPNLHIAFAVWNGDKGDRGSRKSISDWVILSLQPVSQAAH